MVGFQIPTVMEHLKNELLLLAIQMPGNSNHDLNSEQLVHYPDHHLNSQQEVGF